MSNFLIHYFVFSRILRFLWLLPRTALIRCLELYQRTVSPDHGALRGLFPYGYCRHDPTCSSYAILMLEKHGAILGSLCALVRILRCTPWTKPSEKRLAEAVRRSLTTDA